MMSAFGSRPSNKDRRLLDRLEIDNSKRHSFLSELSRKALVFVRVVRNLWAGVSELGRVGRTDEKNEGMTVCRVDFPEGTDPKLIADAIAVQLRNSRLKRSHEFGLGGKRNSIAETNRRIAHSSSLTGYGAEPVSAPMTPGEAPTSAGGDIVRDGTDKTAPEAHDTSVESSVATGAAARKGSQRRPHPKPTTETGSDQ